MFSLFSRPLYLSRKVLLQVHLQPSSWWAPRMWLTIWPPTTGSFSTVYMRYKWETGCFQQNAFTDSFYPLRLSKSFGFFYSQEDLFFFGIFQLELIYHTFGRQNLKKTTVNLDLFLRRFNEIQFWVITEMCMCSQLSKRVQLLKKFIKIAAQWVDLVSTVHSLLYLIWLWLHFWLFAPLSYFFMFTVKAVRSTGIWTPSLPS